MKRVYDKSILLYRIISAERRIEFILAQNENTSLQTIIQNDIINVSYDKMLRDTIEFHQNSENFERVINELYAAIPEALPGIRRVLPKLDGFDNDSNVLYSYYINKLKELSRAEVSYRYHEYSPFSNKASADSNSRLKILIDNIKKIADENIFSYFRNIESAEFIIEPIFKNHTKFDIYNNSRAIILINNSPVLYQISDASLINFFIDFSFEIYKSNEYICLCKHCHETFFGIDGVSYCSNPKCQKEYKRIEKNRKERERRNAPYEKPITTIRNDISTNKSNLLKKVNNDPDIEQEFIEEAKTILEDTREEFKRRKEMGLPPDDDSAIEFIQNEEATIKYLKKRLQKKYEKRNKK